MKLQTSKTLPCMSLHRLDYHSRFTTSLACTQFKFECCIFLTCSIVEEFLNHELTKKMLRVGNNRNMTALHLACQDGHPEVVQKLEPHLDADDVMQEDREKNTALHLACEGGMKDTVQLLLDKGASIEGLINVRNVRDEAPIHFAARYGYEDIAELLLEKGAPINTRDIHRCTPLHHAARNDQDKMIRFLCER